MLASSVSIQHVVSGNDAGQNTGGRHRIMEVNASWAATPCGTKESLSSGVYRAAVWAATTQGNGELGQHAVEQQHRARPQSWGVLGCTVRGQEVANDKDVLSSMMEPQCWATGPTTRRACWAVVGGAARHGDQ